MPLRPRSVAVGIGIGLAIAVLVTLSSMGSAVDARCYYDVDRANPWTPGGCYLYSPPLVLVMSTLPSLMPFDVFAFLLRAAEMAVLVAAAGPAVGVALFIPSVAIELNAANVNLLLVAAVLVGFRFPVAWAFLILTKVTPGIGLLWFAVRREWASLSIAAGATAAFALGSWVIAPDLWPKYLSSLASVPDTTPFTIAWRLPLAILLTVWGARTNRRWALMVAVFMALPRWYYLSPVLLVGLFPLVRLPRPLALPTLLAVRRLSMTTVQPAAATSEGRTARAPSS